MENTSLWNIVEGYKKELKSLWYDTSDENMENLINWFIKIANSMIDDNTRTIPNIDMWSFLLKLSPFKVKINDLNINNNELFNDEKSETTIKFKIDFSKERLNKWIQDIKTENNKSIINDFFDNLEKWNNHLIIDRKIKKKTLIKILKDMKLMDKFNKWELTEKENQIIVELLNN